jgi:hypothetical protein
MTRLARASVLAGASAAVVAGTAYYLLLGCGGNAGPWWYGGAKVPGGTLVTSGTEIATEDRRFQVRAGSPFRAQIWSRCAAGAGVTPTAADWSDYELHGAQRVRVTYPGYDKPLYGILALCEVDEEFKGPAARSYQIEIPEKIVSATEGGRASVVFEHYEHNGLQRIAWAVWLSREPFPARVER